MTEIVRLYQGDCRSIMRGLDASSIDLCITSPPYDDLRTYTEDVPKFSSVVWEESLSLIFDLLTPGGCCIWIVADATKGGSESGNSFRQVLYAQSVGFNIHDTMIWDKGSFTAVGTLAHRYASVFEYMFVLSKGRPKTFNPIRDRINKHAGKKKSGTIRLANGSMKAFSSSGVLSDVGQRYNVWSIPPDKKNKAHPAVFPLALVRDHVLSWSNAGDVVLDPFMGSGTSGIAAVSLGRRFIGIEASSRYYAAAKARISASTPKQDDEDSHHD